MKKVFLLLVISFVCLTSSTSAKKIITTIQPYYSLVKQIAPEAEVINFLPAGTSPHFFDPTPSMVVKLAEADLVILNGVVDEWMHDLVEASGSKAQVIEIFELGIIEPILGSGRGNYGFEGHEGEIKVHQEDLKDHDTSEIDIHGHGHGDSRINSHFWLDPVAMISTSMIIASYLITIDETNAAIYIDNAENLVSELISLNKELKELLEPVQGNAFVPFHDAWPYFARRYNLNLVVEIEPSPGKNPSAKYLAYALGEIKRTGAKAIFSEVQLSPRAAEVVADHAGVNLFLLDPLGGSVETQSYQDLLRYNANVIAKALNVKEVAQN